MLARISFLAFAHAISISLPSLLLVLPQHATYVSAQSTTTSSPSPTPTPPTNLPSVDPGVFSVKASILINASVEEVWNAVLDFPSYPEWNPFVRSQIITSPLLIPISPQIPAEDLRLIITSQIPPLPLPPDGPPITNTSTGNPLESHITIENITHYQPDVHRIAWKLTGTPDALLSAERWSAVSEFIEEDGDGDETRWAFYESREVYDGAIAGIVQTLEGEGLQKGFEAQGEALKMRVEGLRN
ncbi:hypothetical protein D9758_012477 [Tetrapyrgos nigripes]|uniref:Coenzyme Q-binding protein COQ10 START domain-containing protein n=1 Tax=Tetrapyrgos nigripes TaxID=182062 RepID=A0A8H5CYM3_9AGAR|nr:hypothetical protein D9758_012477 [Tetrapyrgos nigripes]